ncbi:MAG TPA: hypothetical protein VNM92_03270 [Thermoanaerobaculia bacterium]|nr:hypothetical protein [Thermoanaerobaculia bacterium]
MFKRNVENEAKRDWRIFRHTLGSDGTDALVYEESDVLFDVYAERLAKGQSFSQMELLA